MFQVSSFTFIEQQRKRNKQTNKQTKEIAEEIKTIYNKHSLQIHDIHQINFDQNLFPAQCHLNVERTLSKEYSQEAKLFVSSIQHLIPQS